MTLEAGSLILASYTAKVKDTGELIETTLEEVAKSLGAHDPTRKYEPRLLAVGEGWVLKGVDESLQNANVGDKLNLEIPPEKGFGLRDPGKVRLLPLRKFGDKADELSVGDQVEVDNRIGIVRYLGSGRAQLDFNHRLAGKTLIYEVEVLKKLGEPKEIIKALIRRRLLIEEEKVSFTLRAKTLRIDLPSQYYLVEGLQIIKRAISDEILKFVKSVNTINFVESYQRPKEEAKAPEEPEPKAEEKKAEAKPEEGPK